ncbi:MAG: lipopolysaccharide biosynthesis protein [Roseibium sp.]|uniref:lipopolysaccharide biosynthesis protein n=1 Tax=Roseibium sp. TaxID=1936156 RepID=UPI003D9C5AB2
MAGSVQENSGNSAKKPANAEIAGDAAAENPQSDRTAADNLPVAPGQHTEKLPAVKQTEIVKQGAKKLAEKVGKVAPVIPLPVKGATLSNPAANVRILRPQQVRRRLLFASLFLAVLLPGFLGGLYFAFIASDRYVAGAGFAVRGVDGVASVGGDFLGALTGLASTGSTTTDAYILLEFLQSRELVERLIDDYEFRSAYGSDSVDFLYRLDVDAPIEDVVDYWEWMITPSFDSTSGIVTFEVEAFDPDDAQRIAALILKYAAELINRLSEEARRDAVKFSTQEVSKAEVRLRVVRDQLRKFREVESAIDPSKNAEVQIELMAGLERQLIEVRSRLSVLKGTIDDNSPAVQQLKRQEAALLEQIVAKQSEIGGPEADAGGSAAQAATAGVNAGTPLSSLLADYEALQVETEFAQQAYVTALASLERARAEADRQQRYLAVFSTPSYPEDAIYPRRILNIFLFFIALLVAWSIGTLIVYSVRDHLR